MADVQLIQPITDGKVEGSTANKKENTAGTSELGKDQFLQLLVTQMQNQNPLEPASDTEWISQLANFSSLEAMQNMGDTMTGLQGMNMVGKYVDIAGKTESGQNYEAKGYVDFVNVKEGKVQVSVEGKLYDAADVINVYDDYYLLENGIGGSNETGTGNGNGNTANTPSEKPEAGTENATPKSEVSERIQ